MAWYSTASTTSSACWRPPSLGRSPYWVTPTHTSMPANRVAKRLLPEVVVRAASSIQRHPELVADQLHIRKGASGRPGKGAGV